MRMTCSVFFPGWWNPPAYSRIYCEIQRALLPWFQSDAGFGPSVCRWGCIAGEGAEQGVQRPQPLA